MKSLVQSRVKNYCGVLVDVMGKLPTTMTEEMALVTDMSGVCNAGVTLQTTK